MDTSRICRIVCVIMAFSVAAPLVSAEPPSGGELASLCRQLGSKDAAARVRAAQALGRLADPKAVGPLMTCAGGAKPTSDVFKACAAAMIQLGEKEPAEPTAAARKALSKKSPGLEFVDIDLADVIAFFRDVSKANILVDRHALAKVFGKNLPSISVSVKGPTVAQGLCAALLSMGKRGQVGFLIDKGVVIVSSTAALGKPRPTELTLPGEKKTAAAVETRKQMGQYQPMLELHDLRFGEVLGFLRDLFGVKFHLHEAATRRVNVTAQVLIADVVLTRLTMRRILEVVLLATGAGDKLAYGIDNGGVVHVSTREALARWRPNEMAAGDAKSFSFGMPKVEIISEKTVDGRKVVRYEHGVIEQWGYSKPQRDFFNLVHPKTKVAAGKAPLHVVLHSAGHSGDSAMTGGFKNPDWIHYHGRPGFYVLYLDCRRNNRTDWWWGHHAIKREPAKYRDRLCPTEERVLSTIEWVIRKHKIDRSRVYLSGISMGGSGSLGIGMCRGDVFAAVSVAVPAGIGHVTGRMTDVGKAARADPPVIVNYSSHIDNWAAGQEKLLAYCRKQRYPMVFAWGLFGHTNNISAANPAAYEYPWRRIRKNEAYPVFANASTDNRYPGHKNRTAPDQNNGQINAYFRWRSVSETVKSFVMELRLVKKDELSRPTDTPREAVADVTLRRLRKFAVIRGRTYPWQMTRGGKVTQSGRAQPDVAGLLTIPRLRITDVSADLAIGPDRAPR